MTDSPPSGSQVSMAETASEPRTMSPESSAAKTPGVSMPPESISATTPASQPKSQPPKRRGKGKLNYFRVTLEISMSPQV